MKKTKETKTNKKEDVESTKKTKNSPSKKVSAISQWYKSNKVMAIGILVIMAAFVSGYYLKGMLIAATVNGNPVWKHKVVKQLERYYGASVLDSLVTQTLIENEAKKNGLSVSKEELDNAVKEIEDSMLGSGTTLDEVLKQNNMTREDLEKDYEVNLLIEKVLASRIVVTDEEVQTYIDENQDSFPEGTDTEEIKTIVKDQLTQDKMNAEYQVMIQELKGNAEINSMVDYYTSN